MSKKEKKEDLMFGKIMINIDSVMSDWRVNQSFSRATEIVKIRHCVPDSWGNWRNGCGF